MPDPNTSFVTHLDKPHATGDVIQRVTETLTYMAPMPVRVDEAPMDYRGVVGEVNDVYLTLGAALPGVFGFQTSIGGPFGSGILLFNVVMPFACLILPLLAGESLIESFEFAKWIFTEAFTFSLSITLLGWLFFLLLWLHHSAEYARIRPPRFNRQRREVCLFPDDLDEPVYIPWESISAWVTESGPTVGPAHMREYTLGIGFHHHPTGQDFTLEFSCAGRSLAVGTWDAIRAYMDYELHTWHEIHSPADQQYPNDPPHEGLHTFRNAKARMRRRYKAGEVGRWYVAGWYFWHLYTFWTLPFLITEWEVRRAKWMMRRGWPEDVQAWSQPLPKEQWVGPSAEFIHQRERLEALRTRYPGVPRFDLLRELHRHDPHPVQGRR